MAHTVRSQLLAAAAGGGAGNYMAHLPIHSVASSGSSITSCQMLIWIQTSMSQQYGSTLCVCVRARVAEGGGVCVVCVCVGAVGGRAIAICIWLGSQKSNDSSAGFLGIAS